VTVIGLAIDSKDEGKDLLNMKKDFFISMLSGGVVWVEDRNFWIN